MKVTTIGKEKRGEGSLYSCSSSVNKDLALELIKDLGLNSLLDSNIPTGS